MTTLTEWTEENDARFAEAVQDIKERLDEGHSLEWAIDATSELFGIDRDALVHEYNLRA